MFIKCDLRRDVRVGRLSESTKQCPSYLGLAGSDGILGGGLFSLAVCSRISGPFIAVDASAAGRQDDHILAFLVAEMLRTTWRQKRIAQRDESSPTTWFDEVMRREVGRHAC